MKGEKEISQVELSEAWAKIAIEKLIRSIVRNDIGVTHLLQKSFSFNILTASDLSVSKIMLMFQYYGIFSDMGVGKGLPLASVKENRSRFTEKSDRINRKPKKWLSPVIYAEHQKLIELLSEYHQLNISRVIIEDKSPSHQPYKITI